MNSLSRAKSKVASLNPESKSLVVKNIVLYSINLDIFSVAIEFLTTNDLDSGEYHEVQDNVVSGAMASTNHSTEELGAHHEVEDNEEEITNDVGIAMQSSSEISRPSHNIATQVRVFCLISVASVPT